MSTVKASSKVGVGVSVNEARTVILLDEIDPYIVPLESAAPLYQGWRELGAKNVRSRKGGRGYQIEFPEPINDTKRDLVIAVWIAHAVVETGM